MVFASLVVNGDTRIGAVSTIEVTPDDDCTYNSYSCFYGSNYIFQVDLDYLVLMIVIIVMICSLRI